MFCTSGVFRGVENSWKNPQKIVKTTCKIKKMVYSMCVDRKGASHSLTENRQRTNHKPQRSFTMSTTFSTAQIAQIAEMTELVKKIVVLNENIKQAQTLLDEAKKRLAVILPEEGFRLEDENDPAKAIEAKWTDKLTKTLQKALVEQNHGITLTEQDFKTTPSHYVSVAKVKR